jgi:hypothetical protein
MEPESYYHVHKPAADPYSKPDKSNPHIQT